MKYTYAQLAEECAREAKMRREVYPRRSASSVLTPGQRRRIDMMDFLAEHLAQLSAELDPVEPQQTDLLGGD